jgi:diacylglycerol kinase (ATP)
MLQPFQIILNPIAGRGAGLQSIAALRKLFDQYGISYELVVTERRGHAIGLASQAARQGIPVVVAVGGDGTANEVLNGLMQAKEELGAARIHTAMGILSVGRGNDFAYGMGVPTDLEAGVAALARGSRQHVDVGRVAGGDFPAGRYFGNGVGIGFDAVVGFEAAKMKRLRGFLNYVVAAIKTIYLYYHAPQVHITTDLTTFELPALMVSIMNGRRMGGGFMMAPESRVDDGLLDYCIAAQVSKARIFALIPHFIKGDQASQPSIQMGRTRAISVTALKGSLPAHADGETLCTQGEKLELAIVPEALEMVSQPVHELHDR